MSEYKGLFTFDEDNHRYVPIAQADGIIDTMEYEPITSEVKEPLIKDEKIREAIRAWAVAQELVIPPVFTRVIKKRLCQEGAECTK